jgi:hypothetical protein
MAKHYKTDKKFCKEDGGLLPFLQPSSKYPEKGRSEDPKRYPWGLINSEK